MAEEQFGLLVANKKTPLPLRDVSVKAEVQGYVLGLKSILTYVNDSPEPVEVLFKFPLEDSHAVVGLTAVIDGRKIKAEIREKEEARAAYDDAIASGQSAALGEEKSGDVFSIALGNLPPKKNAEVHLDLVGELPIDAEGMVRFSLPSTLKPRYTPAGSVDPLAGIAGAPEGQVEHSSVAGVQGFELGVLNASSQIADVTSPTHSIKSVKDASADRMVVTLAEEKSMDRDLVIQIEHKNPHQATILTETGEDSSGKFLGDPAVMVNFFPELEHSEAACEFIFLVDRSGSMSGSYIRSARDTLILFMKSLPESCRFNIIGFGSSFEKLFSESSVPYSQKTLDKAMGHLQSLQANLGGTELLSPLNAIFQSSASPGFGRHIFILTDGSVSNTDKCIQKVKEYSNFARCYTFGIGSGASTSLVEGLAKAGNGASEFVKEGERMQPKVIRSLKRALQPAVTDVSVKFEVLGQACDALQSPQNLPPLYAGEKLVVYGVLSNVTLPLKGTATLKGQIGEMKIDQSLSFEIEQDKQKPSLPAIHHLAAKALIKDWQTGGKSKEDIVKLSIEGSVISSHTAFIAVDEESSESISAAMKTYDLQAASVSSQFLSLQQQVADVQACMVSNIDQQLMRCERLDSLEDKSAALNCQASAFQRSAKKGKSKGGFFSGLFGSRKKTAPAPKKAASNSSAAAKPLSRKLEKAAFAPEPAAFNSSAAAMPVESYGISRDIDECFDKEWEEDASSDDDEGEFDNSLKLEALEECAPSRVLASKITPQSASSMASAAPSADTLSALINAQQANGSWVFNSSLAQHFGKPLKQLEDACPKDVTSVVWATVLVLALLKNKFSGQQDEWELIAMKTDSWLKKQSLPSGLSIDDLFKAATQNL